MKGEGVSEMRGQEVVLSLDLSLKHTCVGEEKWAVTPWEKPSSFWDFVTISFQSWALWGMISWLEGMEGMDVARFAWKYKWKCYVWFFVTPWTLKPLGSSLHGISQGRTLEGVAASPAGDRPDPGIKPGSPALQAGPLPSEPPGQTV